MRTITIVKYVFALIGAGMLIGAFFIYKSTSSFVQSAATAQGVVVDLLPSRSRDSGTYTYAPVVDFVDQNGKQIEFSSSTSSNPPSYHKGEKVEVLYDPGRPQHAKIHGFFSLWGGAIIVAGIGAVFFLIGAGIMAVSAFKGRSAEQLRATGMPIETQFQSVELNESLSVNGRHPFRILTQWQNPSTSNIHVFKSGNVWFDPSEYLKSDRITVFIEQGNPKKYLVDLSFLPELAE
jgi:hypothetical protein